MLCLCALPVCDPLLVCVAAAAHQHAALPMSHGQSILASASVNCRSLVEHALRYNARMGTEFWGNHAHCGDKKKDFEQQQKGSTNSHLADVGCSPDRIKGMESSPRTPPAKDTGAEHCTGLQNESLTLGTYLIQVVKWTLGEPVHSACIVRALCTTRE